jgi:serine/threonine-protein kinase
VAGASAFVTIQAIVWATSGLAIAAITSRVIYGLHEQVREARELGQYVLEEKIGEGGMGEVYRARHTMLRRPTAVKLLSGTAQPSDLRRFEREVQLTSELTHPNTIVVYDYGHTPDGVFYYAMEYLDGMDLASLVRRAGPLPAARVVHLLKQVCAALGEAHGVGLIHRDIKPENVVVGTRGGIHDFVKVLDFGLVKEVSQEGDAAITTEGTIAGTPHYLPPEAIRGDHVDARSDLYSVGCLGYFLLTGRPVFDGKSVVEVCAAHLHREPEPPSSRRADVPADLEACLLACLEKRPADRPESAEVLTATLVSCECAEGWNAARAEAWWERTSAGPGEPTLAEAPTLAAVEVDLARRADG